MQKQLTHYGRKSSVVNPSPFLNASLWYSMLTFQSLLLFSASLATWCILEHSHQHHLGQRSSHSQALVSDITNSRPRMSTGSSGANPGAPSLALDKFRNFGNLVLFFMIDTVFSFSVLVLPHFFLLTPVLVQSPLSSWILCNAFCSVLATHLISIKFKRTSWLKSQLPPPILPTAAWVIAPKINWNDCFVSKDHCCFYWCLILIARGLLLTLNRTLFYLAMNCV